MLKLESRQQNISAVRPGRSFGSEPTPVVIHTGNGRRLIRLYKSPSIISFHLISSFPHLGCLLSFQRCEGGIIRPPKSTEAPTRTRCWTGERIWATRETVTPRRRKPWGENAEGKTCTTPPLSVTRLIAQLIGAVLRVGAFLKRRDGDWWSVSEWRIAAHLLPSLTTSFYQTVTAIDHSESLTIQVKFWLPIIFDTASAGLDRAKPFMRRTGLADEGWSFWARGKKINPFLTGIWIQSSEVSSMTTCSRILSVSLSLGTEVLIVSNNRKSWATETQTYNHDIVWNLLTSRTLRETKVHPGVEEGYNET